MLRPLSFIVISLCALAACEHESASGTSADPSAAPAESTIAPITNAIASTPAPSANVGAPDASTAITIGRDSGTLTDAGACGATPLPPCPLQAWMVANLNAASDHPDFEKLATGLAKVATFAAPKAAYPNWASIANDGAAAARVGDVNATRAACRECHAQYSTKYAHEMRTQEL